MRRIAVDTNLFVRALVREPSDQGRIAEHLLSTSRFVVLSSVLLKSEWVMRGIMKIPRQTINDLFVAALEMDAFEFVDALPVSVAVKAHAAGMDFADALHVALSEEADVFTTFDRDLVRLAKTHIETVSVELAS